VAPRRVDFTTDAEQEAHDAFRWYRERVPRTGSRFEDLFVQAIVHLAEAPGQGAEIAPGLRRWLLPPFPYAILYEIEPDSILVLTVMHTRRRPGYWRGRGR
jgi:plasmid stabilization system protein ParE